ncbi:EF-hand domain-containing protein D2-like [Haliotis rufescens]|uniref:EF-hand domain-containing protein D2-like n=1 Tax=Haliotis rufescens TaxID=6454 RepID=UPI001EB05B35|nr:EF-hand domain-containing protein D2-like [Haliotis rufescens]
MSETDELAQKLMRRNNINDGIEEGSLPSARVFNPYTEFKEFSRKQIKDFEATFKKYDVNEDKFIDLMELKRMMEKLGAPQTHVSLKNMINEVDEDNDSKISFREFLLIFRKAAAGELAEDSGLYELYANISEIDVDETGVRGAKDFFEAKIKTQTIQSKFEDEIRQEQEDKKREAEEAKERRQAFKAKREVFGQQ